MTMFSVVIPLYQKESTIRETILSVLGQTCSDFEIVVVDDGSRDRGPEIVRELADPRIRLIRQENQGVSAARNLGVQESKGTYAAFLDGDDEWMPGFLEAIRKAIALFPDAGMFGTSSLHRDYVSRKSADSTIKRHAGRTSKVAFFENPHVMPHTSAMVVSVAAFRSCFPDGQGFPPGMRLCEDMACFYRLALTTEMVYVGEPLSIRNNNIEGQTTRMDAEERYRKLPDIERFHRLLSEAEASTPNPLVARFQRYELRHRMQWHMRTGDDRSIRHLLDHLDATTLGRLPRFERSLYSNRRFWLLGRLYVIATKVAWRLHGYPVSGK